MKQNRFSIRIHSMKDFFFFFFYNSNVTYALVNKSIFLGVKSCTLTCPADPYFEVVAAATRNRELTQKFTSVNNSDSGQLVSCT